MQTFNGLDFTGETFTQAPAFGAALTLFFSSIAFALLPLAGLVEKAGIPTDDFTKFASEFFSQKLIETDYGRLFV